MAKRLLNWIFVHLIPFAPPLWITIIHLSLFTLSASRPLAFQRHGSLSTFWRIIIILLRAAWFWFAWIHACGTFYTNIIQPGEDYSQGDIFQRRRLALASPRRCRHRAIRGTAGHAANVNNCRTAQTEGTDTRGQMAQTNAGQIIYRLLWNQSALHISYSVCLNVWAAEDVRLTQGQR